MYALRTIFKRTVQCFSFGVSVCCFQLRFCDTNFYRSDSFGVFGCVCVQDDEDEEEPPMLSAPKTGLYQQYGDDDEEEWE